MRASVGDLPSALRSSGALGGTSHRLGTSRRGHHSAVTEPGTARICQRKTDRSSGKPLQARVPESATVALRLRTMFRDRVLPAGSVGRRSFGNSTPNGRMCSCWSHPGFEVSEPCVGNRRRYDCRQEPRHTGEDLKWPGVGRYHWQLPAESENPRGGARPRGFFLYPDLLFNAAQGTHRLTLACGVIRLTRHHAAEHADAVRLSSGEVRRKTRLPAYAVF